MEKIEKMYAFIAVDSEGEGIVSFRLGNQHMPMVGADMARVVSLKEMAQRISNETKTSIKLCVFTERKEIEVFAPKES